MSDRHKGPPTGTKVIKATVPLDVADYFEAQARRYGSSVSAAAAPVLCAMARGEIRQDFT